MRAHLTCEFISIMHGDHWQLVMKACKFYVLAS